MSLIEIWLRHLRQIHSPTDFLVSQYQRLGDEQSLSFVKKGSPSQSSLGRARKCVLKKGYGLVPDGVKVAPWDAFWAGGAELLPPPGRELPR